MSYTCNVFFFKYCIKVESIPTGWHLDVRFVPYISNKSDERIPKSLLIKTNES